MKMKTMAMLAAGGLMAASLAFITPAFAEDGFEDGMAPQQLAMNDAGTSMQGDMGNASDVQQPARFETASNETAANNPNANVQQQPQQQQPQGTQTPQANVATSDQPTADVASGDEDF